MTEFMEGRIEVIIGDITTEEVDAIVNAANSSLMGGGGVDGAIHRAGGPEILAECKKIRKEQYPEGIPTGHAVATTAGNLKARCVIHTVGPVWHGGLKDEVQLLGECYTNSLKIAREKGYRTIAFPAISTGVYRFPKKIAAAIASDAVKKFFVADSRTQKVLFVFFNQTDADIFLDENVF